MPTSRHVLIGAFCRNFASCIVTFYLPVFFGRAFPQFKAEYAVINAGIQSILGLVASFASGSLAIYFGKKSLWAKPLIAMIGQGLAAPLIMLTCLNGQGFYFSIASFMVYFLVASTYNGPAITMI